MAYLSHSSSNSIHEATTIFTVSVISNANMSRQSNYTQGYSSSTVSSHASRTVDSDAGFLLPFIKPEDKILDVGCGPGTITVGFCAAVPQGTVTGIDISDSVLKEAHKLVAHDLRGRLSFRQEDLIAGLSFADESFDIVYASQLFPHLPPPDLPLRALQEMRRVLKPGGILATRDAAAQHFFPKSLDLENLFTRNMLKGIGTTDWPGSEMPALYRRAGFNVDGGKVRVGTGTTCHSTIESRGWWADGLIGRLRKGDKFRESWIGAGVAEDEIEQCMQRLNEWAAKDDAWYGILQTEIVAWK